MNFSQKITCFILAAFCAGLASCGNSKLSIAEKAINKALQDKPQCESLPARPINLKITPSPESALGILIAKGLVIESTVEIQRYSFTNASIQIFEPTDAGKNLIVESRSSEHRACIRTGYFKVKSMKAIDFGDEFGQPIAHARAEIQFIPEEWLKETTALESWKQYWSGIAETEKTQWIYRLKVSGDEMISSGDGKEFK